MTSIFRGGDFVNFTAYFIIILSDPMLNKPNLHSQLMHTWPMRQSGRAFCSRRLLINYTRHKQISNTSVIRIVDIFGQQADRAGRSSLGKRVNFEFGDTTEFSLFSTQSAARHLKYTPHVTVVR